MELRQRVQELLDFVKTNPPRVRRAMSIERQQRMNANVKEVHDDRIIVP